MKRFFLIPLSFCGIVFAFSLREMSKSIFPVSLNHSKVTFTIPTGTSFSQITKILNEKGAKIVPITLRVIWYLQGKPLLKAGYYEVRSDINLIGLLSLLKEGQVHLQKVTFPEGATISQIAFRLKESKVIDSQEVFLKLAKDSHFLAKLGLDFASSIEGFIFPETYFFSLHSKEEDIIVYLVEKFWNVLTEIVPDWISYNKEYVYNKIKLASIIEKEYRVEEEAPLISSVFINRLNKGMRLESCATLVYIITELQKKPHPLRVLWKDVEIDSPYNTYRNNGLPPTPISNAGRVALKAAFYPAKTNYLFFVVKDSSKGSHRFSGNFRDHKQARRQYLSNFWVKS